jgi:hypothetical protein
MSISQNFPNIKPSLNLDFANTELLDPRVTFTRAASAVYYDGKTVAKAEENLLLQSQTFETASWPKTNVTVTADSTTAPDGTTTADTITDNATNGAHIINQINIITPAGVTHTYSCFLKAGTNNYAIIQFLNAAAVESGIAAVIDLSLGTISETDTGTNATLVSSSITSVGNGWYRVSITGFNVAGFTRVEIGLVPLATGNTFTAAQRVTYIGTGTTIFAWGAQLEQRSSVTAYTPTTTQAITNYIPQLLTAASGVARFDHNPTTGESLGLLVEEQRTNLLLQSEDIDTTWSKTRATSSLNSRVSPSGTLTADRLIASTDDNTHFLSQTFTGTAVSSTFSVYVKAAGLNFVALRLFNGTSQVGLAYYNLSTGATGTVTAGTAAITSVGNGWYRCVLTATLAASASCTADIQLANADNTNSFVGNDFDGVSLWGAQLEAGAFPTSYIPTVASQVTRAADVASMTGANFSSWYNQGEGTVYVEAASSNTSVLSAVVAFSDGTASNRWQLNKTSTAALQGFLSTSGTSVSQNLSPIVANVFFKSSFAIAKNNANTCLNGIAGTTNTAVLVPVVNTLDLGQRATASFLNGTIKKMSYYPIRCTNAQLQALTS